MTIRIGASSSLRRMADGDLLLEVLAALRDRGALGERSLPGAVAHAEAFVAAIPADSTTVLDLGSGGGLPGLVIAARLPHVMLTLCERRERRADLLRLACAQLGFSRVAVVTGDVRGLCVVADRGGGVDGGFDVVTARSFGKPLWTLRCALPLVRCGGVVIVSEPPAEPDCVVVRWPAEEVHRLGFEDDGRFDHVRRFVKS
ncbi:MAG: RsmG family class I SAM-dependent methyltransferase [Ilumatobacteraceae bacterium]